MISDFITGVRYLFRGFGLIRKPGLRRYFLLPLLINTVVFAVLIYFGFGWFDVLVNWILPAGDQWWQEIARVLLWLVFGATVLIILYFFFTMAANLIGAPFNGLLAEKVERHLRGPEGAAGSGGAGFLAGFVPAMVSELQKYAYFLAVALVILVITFIPVINFLSPFLWIVFSAWFLAAEYVAYPMENHEQRFKQVRAALRERRALTLGFGAATMIATMIPLINFVVMPAAVAGATAMWVERWAPR